MRKWQGVNNKHREAYALRCADVAGGTYYFTAALADREDDLLMQEIVRLRAALRTVKQRHPFEIVAMATAATLWCRIRST